MGHDGLVRRNGFLLEISCFVSSRGLISMDNEVIGAAAFILFHLAELVVMC